MSSGAYAIGNRLMNAIRLYITTSSFEPERTEEKAKAIEHLRDRHSVAKGIHWETDPAKADLILFAEHCHYKPPSYVDLLLAEPLLREFPDKCFVHNFDDIPNTFFPGAYSSPREELFDPAIHVVAPYLHSWNPEIDQVASGRAEAPTFLASFTGTDTHSVRSALAEANAPYGSWGERSDISINITPKSDFFKHTPKNQRNYAEGIRSGAFSLCPRGYGTMTYRLLESMQLGRAPVILSDGWLPPLGPTDWSTFSLTVEEKDVDHLPQILDSNAGRAEEMGQLARHAWEEYFSPSVLLPSLCRVLLTLGESLPANARRREALKARYGKWEDYQAIQRGYTGSSKRESVLKRGLRRARQSILRK